MKRLENFGWASNGTVGRGAALASRGVALAMRGAALAMRATLGFAMAFGAAACAPDGPTQSNTSPTPLQGQGDAAPTVSPPRATSATPTESSAPAMPADAQWTIFCLAFQGPTHVNDAERAKVEAVRATQSPDWYVIHEDRRSSLYYGFFKSWDDRNDAREYRRAQNARDLVTAYTDSDGEHPYAQCMFVPLNTPDPDENPAWNLANAKGYWSLEIAAYQGGADRKKAAVNAVRAARAQGIEAYYYHGPSISSVCIGSWPREAVKEQDMSSATVNEDDVPLVMNGTIPQGYRTDNLRTADGRRVEPVAPRLDVQDDTLKAAMKEYPYHAVNGVIGREVSDGHGGTTVVQNPSFLVMIDEVRQNAGQDSLQAPGANSDTAVGNGAPGDSSNGGQSAAPADPGAAADPGTAGPATPPTGDQSGQLKSLGQ